jgi:hypothetical protein
LPNRVKLARVGSPEKRPTQESNRIATPDPVPEPPISDRRAFDGCQRASVGTGDVVCELANILPAAADGADPVPFAAQSIFAKSGKHTRIWQTYFG